MEEEIKTKDFTHFFDHTVFLKDFSVAEFDDSYSLKITIYNLKDVMLEIVPLERVNANTMRWESYTEKRPVGVYKYTLCYVKGTTERIILKGFINIKARS